MFNTLITGPFGSVLNFIYSMVKNYGLAIIVFCIFCKLLLFYFTLKSKRSMFAQTRIQPKMKELQKKYKNDKDRYSIELQKLYKEEKVSPLSGCLPLLITFPILFGLYYVVTQPLTYLLKYSAEQIKEIAQNMVTILQTKGVNPDLFSTISSFAQTEGTKGSTSVQIALANFMSENAAELKVAMPSLNFTNFNFNFLGMNLSGTPTYDFTSPNFSWGLLILVLISVGTAFLTGYLGQKLNPLKPEESDDPTAKSAQSTSKMMIYLMPLMTAFIGFSIPAAVSVYWITNNILSILSDIAANKLAAAQERKVMEKRLEDEARKKRNKKKAAEYEATERKEKKNNWAEQELIAEKKASEAEDMENSKENSDE